MQNCSDIHLNNLNSTEYITGVDWTNIPPWVRHVEDFYLFVIMLIGIPGNSLIICIQSRNRHKSTTDYFIGAMAVYELVCCSLNASLKIIMNSKIWIYIASHTLCRFHFNLVFITTFTSAYFLAGIAVDRYFKTCKPLSNFNKVRTCKPICVAVVFVGFLTGISSYFVFEVDEHVECNVAKKYMKLQYVWNSCILSSTVAIFLVFIFTYVNIVITLRKRVRARKRARSITIGKSTTQQNRTTLSYILKKMKRNKVEPASVSTKTVATSSRIKYPSNDRAHAESLNHETSCSTWCRVPKNRPTQLRTALVTNLSATTIEETVNRTTLMLFVLTVIYTITFSLANIFVMTADTILGPIMVKLCKSLLLINCITNPICFFCMSSKYRASAKRLLFRRRRT